MKPISILIVTSNLGNIENRIMINSSVRNEMRILKIENILQDIRRKSMDILIYVVSAFQHMLLHLKN